MKPSEFDIEVPPPDHAAADIAAYIARLPEPDRGICSAVLLRHITPYRVGRRYRITAAAVRERIRAAMLPVWKELVK